MRAPISPASSHLDHVQKARIYRERLVEWFGLIGAAAQTGIGVHAETGRRVVMGRWVVMGAWECEDAAARIAPIDAVALDLKKWWDVGA